MAVSNREHTGVSTVLDCGNRIQSQLARWMHLVIGICMVVGMLGVGLYPFHSPRNAVSWLANRKGVHFGRHATLRSDRWINGDRTRSSLEIWFEPAEAHSDGTIAAFFTPQQSVNLTLQQYFSTFVIKRQTPNAYGQTTIGVDRILYPGRRVFVTITSGARDSAIFVNGVWADTFRQFPLDNALTGQLVLGTSPIGHNDWHGNLLGLAIYRRELTPEQVDQHYRAWSHGHPITAAENSLEALYLFDEGTGSIVHNINRAGANLNIPENYTVLHRELFEPFWREYQATLSYCRDTFINLVGFMPLGFVFFAYWNFGRPVKHPALAAVVLGFIVSLSIESLQSYLPTRSSGTTDLITNTLGTYLGVRLCSTVRARDLMRRIYNDLSREEVIVR